MHPNRSISRTFSTGSTVDTASNTLKINQDGYEAFPISSGRMVSGTLQFALLPDDTDYVLPTMDDIPHSPETPSISPVGTSDTEWRNDTGVDLDDVKVSQEQDEIWMQYVRHQLATLFPDLIPPKQDINQISSNEISENEGEKESRVRKGETGSILREEIGEIREEIGRLRGVIKQFAEELDTRPEENKKNMINPDQQLRKAENDKLESQIDSSWEFSNGDKYSCRKCGSAATSSQPKQTDGQEERITPIKKIGSTSEGNELEIGSESSWAFTTSSVVGLDGWPFTCTSSQDAEGSSQLEEIQGRQDPVQHVEVSKEDELEIMSEGSWAFHRTRSSNNSPPLSDNHHREPETLRNPIVNQFHMIDQVLVRSS